MIEKSKIRGNNTDGTLTEYAEGVSRQTIRECKVFGPQQEVAILGRDQVEALVAYGVSIAERDLY